MKKLILCSLLLSTALFAVDNNQTVAPSNGAYKAKYDAIFDDVGSYKIVQITGNSVIITNDDENKVELTLKQGSQNVIITYK